MFPCIGELGACSRSGDDIVGFATHAPADIAAARSNQLLCLGARHLLERAGKDERLAGESIFGTRRRAALRANAKDAKPSQNSFPRSLENQLSAARAATGPTFTTASELLDPFLLAFSAKPFEISRPPISSASSISF